MKHKRKSGLSLNPLALAGAAALGYTGLKFLLDLKPGADDDFFHWTGPTDRVSVGSTQVDLPIMYYRDDSFMAVFSAACEPLRALLPSPDLHPVMLPGGRAALAVFAFNYIETSIGPYGEIGIAPMCTFGVQAPPLLPLLLENKFPGWGGFVLHLPVTSRIARDAGRAIYGYTKFVADMEFQKRPAYQRVYMSEGGAHILTLTVRQQGLVLKDNRPLITYSVRDGDLLKTSIPSRAVYQLGLKPGSGLLELGEHEIAEQLHALDVSPTAIVARNYLSRSGILPAGEPIAQADRPHSGYIGQERDFGRFTINYDDAGKTIDQYA